MTLIFASLNATLAIIPLLSAIAWMAWKVWTFVYLPSLHPKEIDVLPYNIPFIGHAFHMFMDIASLYERAHALYGRSRRPYALNVAGRKTVIVTSPDDMMEIFKDEDSYSIDPFFDRVYRDIGNVSSAANSILWRTPAQGFVSLFANLKEKTLPHTGLELLHKQLLTPGLQGDLIGKALTYIDNYTRWDAFFPTSVIRAAPYAQSISLHRWCRDVMMEAQTSAFFGPLLHSIEPSYTTIFDQFDINTWMFMYKYLTFLCKAAITPREQLVRALSA
ncbi:hypothetical protein F5Y16DRAFT_75847 [Xylariaceae sp. FL0255]|nr:hypothetical protein F5Y16DRAFT_75847 [Xylariaceae sp. FL0255]